LRERKESIEEFSITNVECMLENKKKRFDQKRKVNNIGNEILMEDMFRKFLKYLVRFIIEFKKERTFVKIFK
jgi:hypothetical protein